MEDLKNLEKIDVVYGDGNIITLEGLEHIRRRPGMYIGKLGDGSHADDGIYVLLKEVIDNSIDEFRMGHGKTIEIRIENELVHTTADGRRFLVLHGDRFDGVVQCAKWLAIVGDRLYELTLLLNRIFNRARGRLGLGYWSLSQFLKHKVKSAVNFVSRFEEAVAAEARAMNLDGVICGHIHKAEMRDVGGVLYCNDGDWVESLTALVELENGELQILHWQQFFSEQSAALQAGNRIETQLEEVTS